MKRLLLVLASLGIGTVVFAICSIGAFTLAGSKETEPTIWLILAFGSPGIIVALYYGIHSIIKGRFPDLPNGSY